MRAAALALLPVGITLLLEYLAVLFVALVAFFVFREKVRRRLWIAIGLVLAGRLADPEELCGQRADAGCLEIPSPRCFRIGRHA